MYNDVFKTLARFFGKLRVEPDATPEGSTAAPPGLHPPHIDLVDGYFHQRLPLGDQIQRGSLHQAPIPAIDDRLPFVAAHIRVDPKDHIFALDRDGWHHVALDHLHRYRLPHT